MATSIFTINMHSNWNRTQKERKRDKIIETYRPYNTKIIGNMPTYRIVVKDRNDLATAKFIVFWDETGWTWSGRGSIQWRGHEEWWVHVMRLTYVWRGWRRMVLWLVREIWERKQSLLCKPWSVSESNCCMDHGSGATWVLIYILRNTVPSLRSDDARGISMKHSAYTVPVRPVYLSRRQ